MTRTHEKLEREVAALCDLPREELIARWVKSYGCPPPEGVRTALLERAAAWHLQSKRLGGLSPIARRLLRDAKLRIQASGTASSEAAQANDAAATEVTRALPRPGARLVREWNGRTHVVDVTADGFMFDGKSYRSLTAIAKRITGAQWSGPRFFGL